MEERVWRAWEAMPANELAMHGMMKDRRPLSTPEVGSQLRFTAKMSTSISASQKAGMLTPTSASSMQMRSATPLWCVAAAMPSGVPTKTCSAMHSSAMTSV